MKEEEVVPLPSRETCRETTFGFNSQEHDQMDKLVRTLVQTHHLALPALVQAFRDYPCVREETKLLQHIFSKPRLIRDIVSFLVQPRKVVSKYKLSQDELSRYIYQLSAFMRDNLQFYQFYFVLLEDNSELISSGEEWRRVVKDIKESTLHQWFQFLEDSDIIGNEKQASLGYISQIFIPLVKYQYSSSSRVNDYYEERYQDKQPSILLISHFSNQLIAFLCKHSHHSAIFKVLFTLVLVSLEEQEWVQSLRVLTQLCTAAITSHITADKHIQNIYQMIKEVANNISNDKNRTVFAFISAIIDSNLVEAALNRLKEFPLETDPDPFLSEEIIEINIKFVDEIVNIYYLLLKNGIDKNANKMLQLKENILQIKKFVPQLLTLVKKTPRGLTNFSNGQALRRTPLFVLEVFKVVKGLLQVERDFHQIMGIESQGVIQVIQVLLDCIQDCLGENRWNSILHHTLEQIVGLVITTQCFKAKSPSLQKFLDFLIEYSTNKKYVFLNSTRMTNQGDIRSLYNICCKVTLSFEKACKSFGISNDYEEWSSFVVNVLQKYLPTTERTSSAFLPETPYCFESQDLYSSFQGEKQEAFTGYIDEAAEMKESISRIDIVQKWKQIKVQNKQPLQRTTSFQKLQKRNSQQRAENHNTSPIGRTKVSFRPDKAYKSVLEPKCSKKMSQSGTFIKQNSKDQLTKPPQMLERIDSGFQNNSESQGPFAFILDIKKADSLPTEELGNDLEQDLKLSEFDLKMSSNKKSN